MIQSAYDFLKPYLLSRNISTRRKKLIFKVRTRMIKVGDNFGKKEDLCPICFLELNTQPHLTQCSVLKQKFPDIFSNNISNYEDIFGSKTDEMKEAIDLFEKCLRKREQLISQTDK